ncbi:N-acetylglucosamine/diacetylchitobiose ABC transporter substrate-binding protein [Amycolatopsis sp. H20-H5]|uniref:N-acetylglucosamine/diacetylchitobiose ABC transporter substrate-binding protein n=1 Tax=Amycolatopsis sp. H20-H5 TaxID=3046309 RepID=UPI002DB787FD|nr:N-acetylglucosamine/diacetylchitobiose ABC transporter substrate-binding protein [Amycolatopsis sp. H20-H5]MEC3979020.1 N-acetylglucosamine/diacetylchitobiose ABC transporter substrate-binding protein [Amycolatopsis sp. H20-H5]
MSPDSLSRRSVLRSAAAVGLSTSLLTACVTGGRDSAETPASRGTKDANNPFGVENGRPLEVVAFKGGYGDDYVKNAEKLFNSRYARSTIDHKGLQKVGDTLRPRFVANTPPDVVDNTGDGRLDISTLVSSRQLTDLAELLDAPSWDDPTVKVRDTLLPGVVDDGSFGGTCLCLNYVYTAYGFWYSKSLFDQRGWAYPSTWDGMVSLSEEIKKAGISPWTYQGKYPEYVSEPLLTMAGKTGGPALLKAIDNLEPNAWRTEAMTNAAEAFAELAGKGFIMPGSEALSHTEAQAAWCQGKAAFIPCGSWLESEQKGITPDGFEMAMGVVPPRTSSDKIKATGLEASSSESFIVPAKGKNPAGGLELLRMLFSKGVAKSFAQSAGTLPSVAGSADGIRMSSALASVTAAVKAAGPDLVVYRHRIWYAALAKATDDAVGELINGRITAKEWADRIQKAADAIAKDSSVKKYTRQ